MLNIPYVRARGAHAESEARRFPVTAVVAGLVAMAVSYAGPLALVLSAGSAAGLTQGQSA